MIKDNVIKFGYGNIMVSKTFLNWLRLEYIQQPMKIGKAYTIKNGDGEQFNIVRTDHPGESNEIIILDCVQFRFDKDVYGLREKISKINGPTTINFREWVLDFTNYNSSSVNVLKDVLDTVIKKAEQPMLAC